MDFVKSFVLAFVLVWGVPGQAKLPGLRCLGLWLSGQGDTPAYQEALFEKIKQEAIQDPKKVAAKLNKYGLKDKGYFFEIAKMIARHTADYIRGYKLTREQRFEIAKLAAPNFRALTEKIANFDLTQEQRYEIAKIEAEKNFMFSYHVVSFELDQSQRFEVAKIAAENGFLTRFDLYDLDQEQAFEVLKLHANAVLSEFRVQHWDGEFKTAGLSQEQLFEVLKVGALKGKFSADYIYSLTQEQKFIVARAFAEHGPSIISRHVGKLNLTQDQRFEIALAAIRADIAPVIEHFDGYDLNEHHRLQLLRAILSLEFPLSEQAFFIAIFVKGQISREALEALVGGIPASYKDLRQFLIENQANYPYLSPEAIHRLSSDIERSDILLGLMTYLAAYGEILQPSDDSFDFMFRLAGFPSQARDFFHANSRDTKSAVMALVMELTGRLGPGWGKSFAPEVFATKHRQGFLRFLSATRNVSLLVPSIRVLEALNKTDPESLIEKTNDFVEQAAEMTRLNFLSFGYEFDPESYLAFEEKWGTFEPPLTLLSRFQSRFDWKEEVPVLGRVLKSVAQNDFERLKFEGITEADQITSKAQLSPLSAHQIEKWKKERTRMSLFKASASSSLTQDQTWQAVRDIVQTNLRPHLRELSSLKYEHQEQVQETGQMIVQYLEAERIDEALPLINKLLASPHLESSDVRGDLQAIKHWFNATQQKSVKEAIIVTTTSWDPLLLMTIGDLVKTSSCQNYRDGSLIQTLLGYVIDANVQTMVSFALGEEHFKAKADYDRVKDAIDRKTELSAHLTAKRTWIFKFASGEVVETSRVPYAHLRHVLKLGRTILNKPGIRLERGYQQVHGALILMKQQVTQIMSELKADLSVTAKSDIMPIKVTGSKNPGKVYSDAAGGVMQGDYYIP